MEGSLVAPDATLAPAGGTPLPSVEPEPAAQPTSGEPSADQSTADLAIRQAEYTRGQQAFALFRQELGIDGKPTREQIIEAARELRELRELRAKGALHDDAPEPAAEEPDPRIVEAEARAFRAELRFQAAVYGEQFTVDAVNLINLARKQNDPAVLIEAFAGFREKHGRVLDDAAAAATPAPVPGATPLPPTDFALPDESGAPSAPPAPPAGGRRESGVVGAVRDAFRAVATR